MAAKDEYILFLDETNKTISNDLFCLAGFAIKRTNYDKILIPKIQDLKKKYFGTADVVLHYTELKNQQGIYKVFKDTKKRNSFYVEFLKIIHEIDMTILATYFNKKHMANSYGKCTLSDYNVAFRYIIENFVHFLGSNGIGMIVMESRTFGDNSKLQETFYNYLSAGSEIYSSCDVKNRLKCLGFTIKGDNCIGLQVADFIPHTIVRIITEQKDKFSMQETIKSKIYCSGTDNENILGIKNILGK